MDIHTIVGELQLRPIQSCGCGRTVMRTWCQVVASHFFPGISSSQGYAMTPFIFGTSLYKRVTPQEADTNQRRNDREACLDTRLPVVWQFCTTYRVCVVRVTDLSVFNPGNDPGKLIRSVHQRLQALLRYVQARVSYRPQHSYYPCLASHAQ